MVHGEHSRAINITGNVCSSTKDIAVHKVNTAALLSSVFGEDVSEQNFIPIKTCLSSIEEAIEF